MKLLTVQFPPFSSYTIPLWSTYSPVLEHPQSMLFPYTEFILLEVIRLLYYCLDLHIIFLHNNAECKMWNRKLYRSVDNV
jgi:hypothetical protein